MTRAALLQVIAYVMIDNPNPDNRRSSQDIQQLTRSSLSLRVSGLIDAYYQAYYGRLARLATVRGRQKQQLEKVVSMVINFNAMVDSNEEGRPHDVLRLISFDSEQFVDGQQCLMDLHDLIPHTITKGNYGIVRRYGSNALQDFIVTQSGC